MAEADPQGGADEGGDEGDPDAEHEDPRGTMVLLLLFLALIVVMWAWAYFDLLSRG